MAKTRRNKTKQRKTRKQRGGMKQYFIKPIRTLGKTHRIDKEQGNTARKVLQKFIDINYPTKDIWGNTTMPVPPYFLKLKGKQYTMMEESNWNNEGLFQNNNNINLEFIPSIGKLKVFQEKKRAAAKETFEIVKKGLDFLGSGKIVLMSAAATEDIDKNVGQQFMFNKNPFSPIVLIDWGFFESSHDFYHLLNFKEVDVSKLGPRDKIRLYIKPKGTAIEAKDPTDEYQQKYVKKVYENGRGHDLTQNIIIMCIKHNLEYEREKDLSIKEYINNKNSLNFSIYTFSDYE